MSKVQTDASLKKFVKVIREGDYTRFSASVGAVMEKAVKKETAKLVKK